MSIQFLYIPDMMPTCESLMFRRNYHNYINEKTHDYNEKNIVNTKLIPGILVHNFINSSKFSINITKDVVIFSTNLLTNYSSIVVYNRYDIGKEIYMFSVNDSLYFTEHCPPQIIDLVKAFILVNFNCIDENYTFNYNIIPYHFVLENTFKLNISLKNEISSYLVQIMKEKRILNC